jgi:L-alanine-DL-glutamate epimerase-like enolase superfamily enzyme
VRVERREVVPVRIPREGGAYEAVIVIEHDGELQGLGEAPLLRERGGSLEALVAELGGEAPARTPAARCARETAALDLRARREGRPLLALLGGRRRPQVEGCALITCERPNLVAREVERKAAAGFRAFKLKSADGGRSLDQERLGAARWAAGPGARLRLDFNGSLGAAEAAVRLRSLSLFGLELAEQPLPAAAGLGAWQALQVTVSTRLAADESLADPPLAAQLAEAGVTLAMKLATVGGLLAAHELARRATGPLTVGSSFETTIGLAASLHLACALQVEPLACGLATDRLLDDDLATGLTRRGARLRLPDQPGLGVTLNRRALDLYRLDR